MLRHRRKQFKLRNQMSITSHIVSPFSEMQEQQITDQQHCTKNSTMYYKLCQTNQEDWLMILIITTIIVIVLSSVAKPYARVHLNHLSESWSAPGGCQLVGQAANLTFKSASWLGCNVCVCVCVCVIPGPMRQELASTMADSTSSFQSWRRSFNLCSIKDNRFCTHKYNMLEF